MVMYRALVIVFGAVIASPCALAGATPEGSPASNPKTELVQVASTGDSVEDAAVAHEELFAEAQYPSASTCGTCHPKHFREWSVSQHAYSQHSPVYL